MELTDEQLRHLQNIDQFYETWKDVLTELARLPGGMYWRVINSREYLYQYASSPAGQHVKSLGPKTPESQSLYQDFKQKKEDLEERRKSLESKLAQLSPVWRALRLPAIDTMAGKALRALDQVGILGEGVLVVGTYAMKAYEVAAAAPFAAGMDATEDLDFTLLAGEHGTDPDLPRRLLLTLKQIDGSFIVNTNSPKTIVNKRGYRVDLLANKAAQQPLLAARPWKPEVLDGQEWLIQGTPVRVVLVDFEGVPTPVAAPDPRFFALHKLWLSKQRSRSALKASKDRRQGEALLRAIERQMGNYPLDSEFTSQLPDPLREQLHSLNKT